MRVRRSFITAALIAALFGFARPTLVWAEEEEEAKNCTWQYMVCIAKAGQLGEPFTTIADIECAAEWTGCVASKLKWW